MRAPAKVSGEVFQVATGIETSLLELAELLFEVGGAPVEIRHEPPSAGDVPRNVNDISKARRVLGYRPCHIARRRPRLDSGLVPWLPKETELGRRPPGPQPVPLEPGSQRMRPDRGVVRDIVVTFGGRIALTLVIILGDVIVARSLGPEGKGAFALVLALSSLGAVILGFGLDRSLAVYAAKSLDIARHAFANAILWVVVVGSFGVLAIIALYEPLNAVMPPLTSTELHARCPGVAIRACLRDRPGRPARPPAGHRLQRVALPAPRAC